MEHIFLGTGVSEGNQEIASWPWPSSHLKWIIVFTKDCDCQLSFAESVIFD